MDDFYLFAMVNFVPGRYESWQASYNDLAVHVSAKEPTTKTYYFGIPADYADNISATPCMFAFEVYGAREDLYQTHFNSPAMGKFLKEVPTSMSTGMDLMHYGMVGGYIDMPGDKTECGIMTDTKISCTSAAARDSVLAKLAKLATAVEAAESKDDLGIYTFMAFKSLDNDTNARIYARYRSRDAMEKNIRQKEVLDFWMGAKEEIKQVESNRYVPNGKGWLHR